MDIEEDEDGDILANPRALEALGCFTDPIREMEFEAKRRGLTLEQYLRQLYPVED
jgi:hypothetical protein